MTAFGYPFRAKSKAVLNAEATPPSGRSLESIWDQKYDTQTYPAAGTTAPLQFFTAVNADKTLSNMEVAGQFPSTQTFQIFSICLDFLPALAAGGVSDGVATAAGNLDDMIRAMVIARPTWTLNISNKAYGPYSLTLLHGTGGPTGFGWGTVAASHDFQYGRNEQSPGWNYFGRIIIPEQMTFTFTLNFQGTLVPVAQALLLRLSLLGVLSRRVL